MNHESWIPFSDLYFHLNTVRVESSYNRDDYNMILITKLDYSQQIDKKDHICSISSSIIQQREFEFGIATKIFWKIATTSNLRKTSSKNLLFHLVQTEFGRTGLHKTNLIYSRQNPCFKFSRFFSICPKWPMKNRHFLFQQISELAHLMIKFSI